MQHRQFSGTSTAGAKANLVRNCACAPHAFDPQSRLHYSRGPFIGSGYGLCKTPTSGVVWFFYCGSVVKYIMAQKITFLVFLISFSLCFAEDAHSQACVKPPDGLVGWWPGDGDGNAFDFVNGHNGTLTGGTAFTVGLVDEAFLFDGLDDGVVIPDSADFDLTDLTVEAWIKTTNAGGGRRRIISQQVALPNQFWDMSLFDNQLEVCFKTSNAVEDLGAQCLAFTGQNLNDGMFHHVAITREAGVEIKWYIDGVNVETEPITNIGSFTIAADVYIGKLDPAVESHFSVNESFAGLIDEVGLFNRALSESEIQTIFDAGDMGKCKSIFEDGFESVATKLYPLSWAVRELNQQPTD